MPSSPWKGVAAINLESAYARCHVSYRFMAEQRRCRWQIVPEVDSINRSLCPFQSPS